MNAEEWREYETGNDPKSQSIWACHQSVPSMHYMTRTHTAHSIVDEDDPTWPFIFKAISDVSVRAN